jgi:hypothetical protein
VEGLSEKEEIKRDGGRPQKNSGRGRIQKGDAILEPFCYDIKEYNKSFSINPKVWAKVCSDAFKSGRREPAIKIVMGSENKTRLWVIEDEMFHQMREAWGALYGER